MYVYLFELHCHRRSQDLLVHSPYGFNSQGWASSKPGAWSSVGYSVWQRPRNWATNCCRLAHSKISWLKGRAAKTLRLWYRMLATTAPQHGPLLLIGFQSLADFKCNKIFPVLPMCLPIIRPKNWIWISKPLPNVTLWKLLS